MSRPVRSSNSEFDKLAAAAAANPRRPSGSSSDAKSASKDSAAKLKAQQEYQALLKAKEELLKKQAAMQVKAPPQPVQQPSGPSSADLQRLALLKEKEELLKKQAAARAAQESKPTLQPAVKPQAPVKTPAPKEPEEDDEGDEYGDDFEAYDDDFDDPPPDDEDAAEPKRGASQNDKQAENQREIQQQKEKQLQLEKEKEKEKERERERVRLAEAEAARQRELARDREEAEIRKRSLLAAAPERKVAPIVARRKASPAEEMASQQTNSRVKSILAQITLQEESFDLFHCEPLSRNDLLRIDIGRGRRANKDSQWNEDYIDGECQTEKIENFSLSTQSPDDRAAKFQGEKNQSNSATETNPEADFAALQKFLSATAPLMEQLIDENTITELGESVEDSKILANSNEENSTEINSITTSSTFLTLPAVFGRRTVKSIAFSTKKSSQLAIAYSRCFDHESSDPSFRPYLSRGLVLLWDSQFPNFPQKYFYCDGEPATLAIPPHQPAIIIAGLEEGSLVVWDSNEENPQHKKLASNILIRSPSFSTDGIFTTAAINSNGKDTKLMDGKSANQRLRSKFGVAVESAGQTLENHRERVCSIVCFQDSSRSTKSFDAFSFDSSGGQFQFSSSDSSGCVIVWNCSETRGSSSDAFINALELGANIGSRIKLTQISVHQPQLEYGKSDSSLSLSHFGCSTDFNRRDSNEFFVTLATGEILRAQQFGSVSLPRSYLPSLSSQLSNPRFAGRDFPLCISCHPTMQDYFLAGFASGAVSLFNRSSAESVASWADFLLSSNSSIRAVRWSPARASVFFVSDSNYTISLFDLLKSENKPVAQFTMPAAKLAADNKESSTPLGQLLDDLYSMAISLSSGLLFAHPLVRSIEESELGRVAVHSLKPAFNILSQEDQVKLESYLARLH